MTGEKWIAGTVSPEREGAYRDYVMSTFGKDGFTSTGTIKMGITNMIASGMCPVCGGTPQRCVCPNKYTKRMAVLARTFAGLRRGGRTPSGNLFESGIDFPTNRRSGFDGGRNSKPLDHITMGGRGISGFDGGRTAKPIGQISMGRGVSGFDGGKGSMAIGTPEHPSPAKPIWPRTKSGFDGGKNSAPIGTTGKNTQWGTHKSIDQIGTRRRSGNHGMACGCHTCIMRERSGEMYGY